MFHMHVCINLLIVTMIQDLPTELHPLAPFYYVLLPHNQQRAAKHRPRHLVQARTENDMVMGSK